MKNEKNYLIVKTFGNKSADFVKCLLIRRKVFIEEQSIDENIEADEHDAHSYHYMLLLDTSKEKQTPIGTARWRNTDKGIKLERFAVLKEYRNKGYGTIILDTILKDVLPLNKPIYLHAQDSAVQFYLKNGFTIEGSNFLEANLKHYKMNYSNKEKAGK